MEEDEPGHVKHKPLFVILWHENSEVMFYLGKERWGFYRASARGISRNSASVRKSGSK